MRITDEQYLKTRSTRRLWFILRDIHSLSSYQIDLITILTRMIVVCQILKRRDNPSLDVWPDCDSPYKDSKHIRKGTSYKDVRW